MGRVGRLVLQVASDLPFFPCVALLAWDVALAMARSLGHQTGQPNPRRAPQVEGASHSHGSALGGGCCGGPGHPLLHPPGLRLCSQRAGPRLPEQATNCRVVPAADSGGGLCQAAREGPEGMRKALFPSVCVKMGINCLPLRRPTPPPRCPGPVPGGWVLCSTFLGWGHFSGPSLAPPCSQLWSPSTHTLPPEKTCVAEPWLNVAK